MLGIVDHIGIAVHDLDASVSFHVEMLGMQVVTDEVNAAQGVREVMLAPDGTAAVPPDATVVQLIAPLDKSSTVHRFLRKRGEGLHHIAYRVGDIDDATARLSLRGFDAIYPVAMSGARRSRINFLRPGGTSGVLVELVQPADHRSGDQR